ncbi:N-acetylglucosamine-specific PTS transporter subunit IIBC [Helcococcus kunzii]|uniref:N-acetylglucosamine-specific PTS transporter subunit IIBC n=1 Tax=Helcococcus kunzii TaxID=40091 RepID=UPI0038A1A4B7
MKYLQKLGRSFMQVVAVMPLAGLLLGIGYAVDPTGWGANSPLAAFLIKAGGAILDNLGYIFAVGVAFGLAKDNHGAAGLAGLVSFLTVITVLSAGAVAQLKGLDPEAWAKASPFEVKAFEAINAKNVFIGIITGIIGGEVYNKFHTVKLPDFLAFFSGRRLVPILASVISLVVAAILFFVWPVIYVALVNLGQALLGMGPVGAGIYAFFNRLLIPTGLHHALNQVFWFELVGIDDIPNFLKNVQSAITATYHPGMYQAGFFPIMMFGLPAAAIAMFTEARPERKKFAKSLLLAGALASFVTGLTEPIEFAFMLVAPALYLVHAVLTAVSVFLAAQFGMYAGFGFSAGLIDLILSIKNPMAAKIPMLLVQGLVFAALYFVIFKFAIKKFNLQTPGREAVIAGETTETSFDVSDRDLAEKILAGLGGASNIDTHTNCATRLRLTVKDDSKVNESAIKNLGVPGVMKPGKNQVHVIVGPQVERVYDEFKKLV